MGRVHNWRGVALRDGGCAVQRAELKRLRNQVMGFKQRKEKLYHHPPPSLGEGISSSPRQLAVIKSSSKKREGHLPIRPSAKMEANFPGTLHQCSDQHGSCFTTVQGGGVVHPAGKEKLPGGLPGLAACFTDVDEERRVQMAGKRLELPG